jgi:hypothetical protein
VDITPMTKEQTVVFFGDVRILSPSELQAKYKEFALKRTREVDQLVHEFPEQVADMHLPFDADGNEVPLAEGEK